MQIKNILLDRDGTIIQDLDYLSDPGKIRFLENAPRALYRLYSAGMKLFMVSNQSGIGRGLYSHKDFERVQEKLKSDLAKHSVYFESEIHCPHAPWDLCGFRKPGSGMWESLQEKNGIRAQESVIIGDKLTDIEFGFNSALRYSILVLTGRGTREINRLSLSLPEFESYCEITKQQNSKIPHVVAKDLQACANWLLFSD